MNLDKFREDHSFFLDHFLLHCGVKSLHDEEISKLKEPYKTWFNWGLGGFDRAEKTFVMLKKYKKFTVKMRHLDIGCGPGYLSTVFALNNYESIGVDVDVADLAHANTNKRDFPGKNLRFYNMDCTTDELLNLGKFDVITVDNVLEHVESPFLLVSQLKKILNKKGIIHLIIPNAGALDLVNSDPHYNLFGLSLFDKSDGDVILRSLIDIESYDVNNYFYKYDIINYFSTFKNFGFKSLLCDGATKCIIMDSFLNFNIDQVKNGFYDNLSKIKGKLPGYLSIKLNYVINLYLNELEREYAFLRGNEGNCKISIDHFYYKYLSPSFFFILKHETPISHVLNKVKLLGRDG